jgi:hypothetical protein
VTVDHIIPRKRGGGEEEENLRSLCARHAKIKDDKDAAFGRKLSNAKRKADFPRERRDSYRGSRSLVSAGELSCSGSRPNGRATGGSN